MVRENPLVCFVGQLLLAVILTVHCSQKLKTVLRDLSYGSLPSSRLSTRSLSSYRTDQQDGFPYWLWRNTTRGRDISSSTLRFQGASHSCSIATGQQQSEKAVSHDSKLLLLAWTVENFAQLRL